MKLKKCYKYMLVMAMTMIMALGLTACGFSVGTPSESTDYKDLFPDAAANLGGSYKTSNLSYRFTVDGDYGEMTVHVDTSNGHSFEIIEDGPAGFKIKDSDGNDALYAACLEKEQYAELTSRCSEVKTVNGREFLYCKNGDGSEDLFSYMDDCGLNCGLALEVHDGNYDNFRLVAFRGEPLEGSTTDVHAYQGTPADEGAVVEETPDAVDENEESTDVNAEDTTTTQTTANANLDSEIASTLNGLNTDYNKVKWGSVYSIFPDNPGIVISVAPGKLFNEDILVVAITNLYDQEISFSGSAKARGKDDAIVGETFIYQDCIGAGNTVIEYIDCDSTPDGRISWEECEIGESYQEYVPWEADYQAKGNAQDGYLTVEYGFFASNGDACDSTMITILLVDGDGYITGVMTDYMEAIAENETRNGSVDVYGDESMLSQTKDIAIFANSVKPN